MADRYLYMGCSPAFTRNVGTVATSTGGTFMNSTYVDHASQCGSGVNYFFTDFTDGDNTADHVADGETLWLRFDYAYSGGSPACEIMKLVNNSDQPTLRWRLSSTGIAKLEYNSGTLATPAWTQVGANYTVASSTLQTIVLKLTLNSAGSHSYEMYQDSVLAQSGTFTESILTRVDSVQWCHNTSTNMRISQTLASVGITLVGSFCASLKASGAGSNSGMTGAYTDVNEVTFSDTTVVSSNTAGQRTTFAIADLGALSGMTVGSEQRHVFRCNNDGGAGPQNIKPVIRQSGSDTVGSAVSGLSLSLAAKSAKYNLTYTQINTAGFELGWESAA